MKKSLCVFLSTIILFTLSACFEKNNGFTTDENDTLLSASGTKYAHLANEGALYYLGELVFQGSVNGEPKNSQHLGISYKTGLFSIQNDETCNVLVRYSPNNEWFRIYRKASLPSFDFSIDNCVRLELILGIGDTVKDNIHTICGKGINGKTKIAEFLSDVRSQKSPKDAGLYDLITKPDGMLENCYTYAVIYGFFEEEPNLAVRMEVTSFNDLAYSVTIDDKESVLPELWLERLQTEAN